MSRSGRSVVADSTEENAISIYDARGQETHTRGLTVVQDTVVAGLKIAGAMMVANSIMTVAPITRKNVGALQSCEPSKIAPFM